MALQGGEHLDLLNAAITAEAEAQRALLAGEGSAGRAAMRAASRRYRESWEVAPPASYGRLIGMLKAAIIAGDATAEAAYAREALPFDADSPPASYARALAALVEGDDATARAAATAMERGSPAFARTAEAIAALADGDGDRYARAVRSIVADFEGRDEHLTGVPFADTALMLEQLAEARSLACRPGSALLPPPG